MARMNNEVFLKAMAAVGLVVSLGTLALGIRVSSGRPFLLRTRIYYVLAVLILVVPMMAPLVGTWPPDWESVLITLLVPVLLISLLLFVLRRTMGDVALYNVTEGMVRETLEEALDEHGLAWAEGDPPGFLSRVYGELYAQTQFSYVLDGLDSSVRVQISPLGGANLRFKGKRAIPDYDGLVARLDRNLQARVYEGSRLGGCLPLIGSVMMLALFLWLLLR